MQTADQSYKNMQTRCKMQTADYRHFQVVQHLFQTCIFTDPGHLQHLLFQEMLTLVTLNSKLVSLNFAPVILSTTQVNLRAVITF